MSILAVRLALQSALISEGAALGAETQALIADALAKTSAVDAVVAAFDALAPLSIELGAATRAALLLACEALADKNFHDRGEAAALILATA